MTEERLITGMEVTSGEAPDGRSMKALVEQSVANGVAVKEVLGDTAFSTIENIEYCKEKDITLIAMLNPQVVEAATPKDDGFFFNKDAGRMQCPAGEIAINAKKRTSDHGNAFMMYTFSKVKCRKCPLAETCRVGCSKTKTYSVTLPNERTLSRIELQNTEYFKERLRHRYKIEQKHGEMKCAHGFRKADSTGLIAMRLQSYFTAFAANVKRIVKLAAEKQPSHSPALSAALFVAILWHCFLRFPCIFIPRNPLPCEISGFFSDLNLNGF
jgi:radical SAM protein with 4Fe4S-binding SPASM domain